MPISNDKNKKIQLEAAQNEFLRAWAASQSGGPTPNLPDIARRHPQVALELTQWATDLVAREAILAKDTQNENEELSEVTRRVVDKAKKQLRARPKNMSEAVEAFGLSQFDLAASMRLSPSITSYLCEGQLTALTSDFEDAVAVALPLPASHIAQLLASSAPSAKHFSSQGDPSAHAYGTISLREAIEDAVNDDDISPENARFWLDKLDAEGK